MQLVNEVDNVSVVDNALAPSKVAAPGADVDIVPDPVQVPEILKFHDAPLAINFLYPD